MNDERRRQITARRKKQKKIRRLIRIAVVSALFILMCSLSVVAWRVTPEGLFRQDAESPETQETETGRPSASAFSDLTLSETEEPDAETESRTYEAVLESSEAEDASGLAGEAAETIDPTEQVDLENPDGLRVWIGDSRTVGMQLYTRHDPARDVFIGEIGMAFPWFSDYAVTKLRELIAAGNVTSVYINMGVNDCAAAYQNDSYPVNDYIRLVNSLVFTYPEVRFYFYSVGPGSGEYYGSVNIPAMNSYVNGFNYAMREYCAAVYIDDAEYIIQSGYQTTDGIHYDSATYQKIYDYVLAQSE